MAYRSQTSAARLGLASRPISTEEEVRRTQTACAHDRRHVLALFANGGAAVQFPRRQCCGDTRRGRPTSGIPGDDPQPISGERSRTLVVTARWLAVRSNSVRPESVAERLAGSVLAPWARQLPGWIMWFHHLGVALSGGSEASLVWRPILL
jgi:hypothetical protein